MRRALAGALMGLLLATPARAQTPSSSWAEVRALWPAYELKVATKAEPSAKRYFLKADETTLTVFNFANPALTKKIQRAC